MAKEIQAFDKFVPINAHYLVLGSFPTKESAKEHSHYDCSYDWFYANGRNQFWPILEAVYNLELTDKMSKQKLFVDLGIAIADIIFQCKRLGNSSLDKDLSDLQYNLDAITEIVDTNPIKKIFFTSRFVEKKFKRFFKKIINSHPEIELVTLPSPSPRYVLISKKQKIAIYKKLLPKKNGYFLV